MTCEEIAAMPDDDFSRLWQVALCVQHSELIASG